MKFYDGSEGLKIDEEVGLRLCLFRDERGQLQGSSVVIMVLSILVGFSWLSECVEVEEMNGRY